MNYRNKYLKYKYKYLGLKGGTEGPIETQIRAATLGANVDSVDLLKGKVCHEIEKKLIVCQEGEIELTSQEKINFDNKIQQMSSKYYASLYATPITKLDDPPSLKCWKYVYKDKKYKDSDWNKIINYKINISQHTDWYNDITIPQHQHSYTKQMLFASPNYKEYLFKRSEKYNRITDSTESTIMYRKLKNPDGTARDVLKYVKAMDVMLKKHPQPNINAIFYEELVGECEM